MPTTAPDATIPALDALRRPIRDYAPEDAAGHAFRADMLDLTEVLKELWFDDEAAELEGEVVLTALNAFPGLIAPGPSPARLVEMVLGHVPPAGDKRNLVIDAETADTLHTLRTVRGILQRLEPAGFAPALLRAVLLAIYRLIELVVLLGDEGAVDPCLELLDTAEAWADRLAGRR